VVHGVVMRRVAGHAGAGGHEESPLSAAVCSDVLGYVPVRGTIVEVVHGLEVGVQERGFQDKKLVSAAHVIYHAWYCLQL
jgi:hypothetical protein